VRAFALLLAVILAAVVVVAALRVAGALRSGRDQRQREQAVWKVTHASADGRTVVAVALTTSAGAVLQRHIVAELQDSDPAWQTLFLTARQEAEERAFHLNS
jgi:pyridoxamine 5'-phosphate oxidase family protein